MPHWGNGGQRQAKAAPGDRDAERLKNANIRRRLRAYKAIRERADGARLADELHEFTVALLLAAGLVGDEWITRQIVAFATADATKLYITQRRSARCRMGSARHRRARAMNRPARPSQAELRRGEDATWGPRPWPRSAAHAARVAQLPGRARRRRVDPH
jgi:hypothetical protein